jgi:hypothetical protein
MISDRSKWYNLDEDSEELMQTTQGQFLVVVQSAVTTTGAISMPVLLRYSIEMVGTAKLTIPTGVGALIFPAGTFAYVSSTVIGFTIDPAETVPLPSYTAGVAYGVQPAYQISWNASAGEQNATCLVIMPTSTTFNFYKSMEDFEDSTTISCGVSTFSQKVGRTIWAPLGN